MDALYFAYGSNLHEPQMTLRCASAVLVEQAILHDHRLTFFGRSSQWDGGGVATVVPASGAQVPGAIYRLSAEDMGPARLLR
ncbi:MAG: gamma-glutamylcyclotransferase, partial [Myxococcales bacterium]|nr:gamma-glutamylcyclotransferase [Myxococcales bacterium]